MADDEVELNSILNDAVQLRQSQDAFLRRYFDSLPGCIQRTLFEAFPLSDRTSENCKSFLSQGDTFLRRNKVIEALGAYEKAIGCVWYVVLRPKAPHWRERGVQDEWIRIVKNDQVNLIVESLGKCSECVFRMKQWNECMQMCDSALRMDPNHVASLLLRARCRLKLPNKSDTEDSALADLVKVTTLDPLNAQAKTLLLDIRSSIRARNDRDKKAFGGLFNKPGVRLADETDEDNTRVKTDLDPVELEAASLAGLDVRDPAIRELLIKLSTPQGRELFEREEVRLKKVHKKDYAFKWLVIALTIAIFLAAALQFWLKSMTVSRPVDQLGDIHRVKRIMKQQKQSLGTTTQRDEM